MTEGNLHHGIYGLPNYTRFCNKNALLHRQKTANIKVTFWFFHPTAVAWQSDKLSTVFFMFLAHPVKTKLAVHAR